MAHLQHDPTPNAIFYGEQGTTINIHDGIFTQHNYPQAQHNCSDADDAFKRLQAHVATTAYNSADQVDVPQCHPNTREAVQKDIMDWILQPVAHTQWMLWLNSAAGAGKTAIAHSIVALCLVKNIPIAQFFFFRTDSTWNTLRPVVAMLVYQLLIQVPQLRHIVIPRIEFDPLVFTESLETELQYLVFEPLQSLHCDKLLNTVVLMFDGVDECNGHENQTHLIHIIAKFLSGCDLPIIAFFGSCAEHQLQQVFRSHNISSSLHQLALDTHYLPDADILLFLNDKFRQIKQTHLFSDRLDKDWPDPAHVREIVSKSSSQFIYASVVINFVSSSRCHLAKQLEIIRGLRPVGNSTPFAQLDELYKYIFSQVNDHENAFFLLAWKLFAEVNIEESRHIDPDDIPIALVDLVSILTYEHGSIVFLHASLPDFLLDRTRSRECYFDKRIWCTRFSVHCLSAGHDSNDGRPSWSLLFRQFIPHAEVTAELRDHLLVADFRRAYRSDAESTISFLTTLRTLSFADGKELYQILLERVIRHILEFEF